MSTELETLARYILWQTPRIDHACSECLPLGGDMVTPGFRCAYHLALSVFPVLVAVRAGKRVYTLNQNPSGVLWRRNWFFESPARYYSRLDELDEMGVKEITYETPAKFLRDYEEEKAKFHGSV